MSKYVYIPSVSENLTPKKSNYTDTNKNFYSKSTISYNQNFKGALNNPNKSHSRSKNEFFNTENKFVFHDYKYKKNLVLNSTKNSRSTAFGSFVNTRNNKNFDKIQTKSVNYLELEEDLLCHKCYNSSVIKFPESNKEEDIIDPFYFHNSIQEIRNKCLIEKIQKRNDVSSKIRDNIKNFENKDKEALIFQNEHSENTLNQQFKDDYHIIKQNQRNLLYKKCIDYLDKNKENKKDDYFRFYVDTR